MLYFPRTLAKASRSKRLWVKRKTSIRDNFSAYKATSAQQNGNGVQWVPKSVRKSAPAGYGGRGKLPSSDREQYSHSLCSLNCQSHLRALRPAISNRAVAALNVART